jgi:hypothetical protein
MPRRRLHSLREKRASRGAFPEELAERASRRVVPEESAKRASRRAVPEELAERASRRVVTSFVALAATALLLAGCAGQASVSSTPLDHYKGEPHGITAPASSAGGAPWAVWMKKDGSEFAVTLYGSAECPPYATGYKVTAPDEITMKLKKAGDDCPDGYAPFTTVFQTPPSLDRQVTIQFTAQSTHFYLSPVKKK